MITVHPIGFIFLLVLLVVIGVPLLAASFPTRRAAIAARAGASVALGLFLLGIVAWTFLLIDFELG